MRELLEKRHVLNQENHFPWLEFGMIAALILLLLALVCLVLLLLRRPTDPKEGLSAALNLSLNSAINDHLPRQFSGFGTQLNASLGGQLGGQLSAQIGTQMQTLREETGRQSRDQRAELAQTVGEVAKALTHQMGTIASVQNGQIDTFSQQLVKLIESNDQKQDALRQSLLEQAHRNREALDKALMEMRGTLETKIKDLQTDNALKLDEMRKTVDEKLHATLEARLGESFKQVSDRLEQVHRGLGEMQALASDVGDLKRVLTNVKTRGTWGEVQLEALLEQLLVHEQYERNVEVVKGSGERVEFAIRLPGKGNHKDQPVWLPIDAKFPREDYERLLTAFEKADADGAELAGRQLEATVRDEAKKIKNKYISPPSSTDFALLFLPVEGLYAEIVRRPGLVDTLQREYRIVVAGPTTLAAILSSLQMGFRTLAVEQRSSEVWQLLGAVKTEFGKFGDILAKTKEQLERAAGTIGSAEVRTRSIERKLRAVEELPGAESRKLLPEMSEPEEG
jgi:DNA recombination protein RmuC